MLKVCIREIREALADNRTAFTKENPKNTFPDGKTAQREVAPGTATWNQSETHVGQIGDSETHTVLVELKAPRATAKI